MSKGTLAFSITSQILPPHLPRLFVPIYPVLIHLCNLVIVLYFTSVPDFTCNFLSLEIFWRYFLRLGHFTIELAYEFVWNLPSENKLAYDWQNFRKHILDFSPCILWSGVPMVNLYFYVFFMYIFCLFYIFVLSNFILTTFYVFCGLNTKIK